MSDTPSAPAAVAPLPQDWVAYITPFATTVGKSVDEVTALLKPVVGEPGDQAISLLKDATASPDADIKAALIGVPSAVANRAIAGLRQAQSTQPVSGSPEQFGGLPAVMADASWISALRAGGVLKSEPSTVIAAVRAALAHRLGLFEVPDLLVTHMERFADQNADPVPAEFYQLRKDIKRRDYADIFEAIPGFDGNFVTDARKKQLFERIDAHLWPALTAFFQQLKGWYETWVQSTNNPAVLNNLAARLSGAPIGVMPPGMSQPPDTGVLHDEAESFNDAVNKVFAGTGVQIVAAVAVEANRIKGVLENDRLPTLIGAANREQMLRQLGVEVSATYPRLETNLSRFVLSILQIKDVPSGNEEAAYFGSLYTLGMQINWDQLSMGKRATRPAR